MANSYSLCRHCPVLLISLFAMVFCMMMEGTQSWTPDFMVEDEYNFDFDQRFLQDQIFNDTMNCYSSRDSNYPNRYCMFDNTPRDDTFLVVSCPDSDGEDLSQCECTIGIGNPEDAPNTPTCETCFFCKDGTLSYTCEKVARGTCIGRDCRNECIASLDYAAAVPRSMGMFGIVGAVLVSLLSLLQ